MRDNADVFVHDHALCESEQVGRGTRIWAFAHVMKDATVGCDCNIGDHAFIESGACVGHRVTIKNQVMVWDGVEIGDDVFVGPGVTFTNDLFPRSPRMELPAVAARYRDKTGWLLQTRIERSASLGARCVIVAGVTVGAYAMVAAGAVVTRDVAEHSLVAGVPARRIGWVCRCGARLLAAQNAAWRCPQCAETFQESATRECTSLVRSC
jgi:UDP-2-acetamido-3-amino-2,3-dideoxy-glucuronate N-acetyltransferase